MKVARWVFAVAGIWGIVNLVPLYFMEGWIERQYPPAFTHPEFYYGFIGLGLMWQFAFFLIASDPERYRPFMWLGIGEKLSFFLAAMVLLGQSRLTMLVLPGAIADVLLAVAFFVALVATARASVAREQATFSRAPLPAGH